MVAQFFKGYASQVVTRPREIATDPTFLTGFIEIVENSLVCIVILSMEFVECYTLCSTFWKEVGQPPVSLRPVLNYALGPEARYSGIKMCDSKHCLVFT
jgi:hypothetical protein